MKNLSFVLIFVTKILLGAEVDRSFGSNGIIGTGLLPSEPRAAQTTKMALFDDGVILVAGFDPSGKKLLLKRFATDGKTDLSFGQKGKAELPVPKGGIFSLAVYGKSQESKIALASIEITEKDTDKGKVYDKDFLIHRYLADGKPDPSFGNGGFTTTDFGSPHDIPSSLEFASDGTLVVVGQTIKEGKIGLAVARYDRNGVVDRKETFFFKSSSAGGQIVRLQKDGKFVVGSSISKARDLACNNLEPALVRFTEPAIVDRTFSGGQVFTDFGMPDSCSSKEIKGMAIYPDGKILVLGGLTDSRSGFGYFLGRYNKNGSLDTSFNQTGKVISMKNSLNSTPEDLAIQSDGKILIALRYFDPSTSKYQFAVVRYRHDGTPDNTFSKGGSILHPVRNGFSERIAVQPGGRILVGGSTTPPNFAIVALTP